MAVKICTELFNPWQILQSYQDTELKTGLKHGATSVFVGSMRDYNDGDNVLGMTLAYYPGMTEKCVAGIVADAGQRWRILDAYVVHRVGEISPGEAIVLVAVWSAHRGDAFDASRFIMEALKSTAPFWKNERLVSGQTRWVENNTGGYQGK